MSRQIPALAPTLLGSLVLAALGAMPPPSAVSAFDRSEAPSGTAERLAAAAPGRPGATKEVVWVLDNLATVGGHRVRVVGNPRVVTSEAGRAVEFNGSSDGLFLDVNPLAGLERFTIEALVAPASDGPEEQRFLHFQETRSENRAMMETRILPDKSWCLDTFLRHDPASLTLIDRRATHSSDHWHVAALQYDGKVMAHYVDGAREAAGPLQFAPIGTGRTSIGVRQNLTYWFKGRIRLVRITPEALPANRLLAAPRAKQQGGAQ
jgi:hypothetical protein